MRKLGKYKTTKQKIKFLQMRLDNYRALFNFPALFESLERDIAALKEKASGNTKPKRFR